LHHNNKIESTVNTQPLSFSTASQQSTVNSQQSTVNSQQSTVNSQQSTMSCRDSSLISFAEKYKRNSRKTDKDTGCSRYKGQVKTMVGLAQSFFGNNHFYCGVRVGDRLVIHRFR
jgi:hypothetical protein